LSYNVGLLMAMLIENAPPISINEDLKSVSREQFNEICDDLFKECISNLLNILKMVKLSAGQLSDIVLVGGSIHYSKNNNTFLNRLIQ
jgi:molecular chaperone DnaK (HSP70)